MLAEALRVWVGLWDLCLGQLRSLLSQQGELLLARDVAVNTMVHRAAPDSTELPDLKCQV